MSPLRRTGQLLLLLAGWLCAGLGAGAQTQPAWGTAQLPAWQPGPGPASSAVSSPAGRAGQAAPATGGTALPVARAQARMPGSVRGSVQGSVQARQVLEAAQALRQVAHQEADAAWQQPLQAGATAAGDTGTRPRGLPSTQPVFDTRPGQTVSAAVPGLHLVNRHLQDIQVTPGGLYTLDGVAFGAGVGSVDLVGPDLPGGRLALQVTRWGEARVQALLPEPITGLPDQRVTLRLTTRAGLLYTKPVQFMATRAVRVMHTWSTGAADADRFTLDRVFQWSGTNLQRWAARSQDAGVLLYVGGDAIDCPPPGRDTLIANRPLAPGWLLTQVDLVIDPPRADARHDRWGGEGSTSVTGAYQLGAIAGSTPWQLQVDRAVERSHSTRGVNFSGKFHGSGEGDNGDTDQCRSAYDLVATFVGPAGLSPF